MEQTLRMSSKTPLLVLMRRGQVSKTSVSKAFTKINIIYSVFWYKFIKLFSALITNLSNLF